MSTIAIGPAVKPAVPEAEVKYWGLLAAFAALAIVCLLPTPKGLLGQNVRSGRPQRL